MKELKLERYEILITPQCCEACEKHKAIYLLIPYECMNPNLGKPEWRITCYEKFQGRIFEGTAQAFCCPFCGQHVPNIEKSGIDEKLICTHDGYYCETCGERCSSCSCLPPEYRWKPVGKEVKLPQ